MYLSYSGFKKYRDCPRSYWHSYIDKTSPSQPANRIGALYGSIVGRVFELFYNDKLWRNPDRESALLALVPSIAEETVQKETRTGILNWKDPKYKRGPRSMDEVIDAVRKAIPNGLRIIRQHRLLGVGARAEVKLDSYIEGHLIGGRCDFLMRRILPDGDVILLDGKGSAYREKYVDEVQLLWYAMLHRKKYGVLPDRLAFVFWRSSPDEALDWVIPTQESVDELQSEVLSVIQSIEERTALLKQRGPIEVFPARAREFNCKFCPYLSLCPEGQSMVSEKRPPDTSEEGVEDVAI